MKFNIKWINFVISCYVSIHIISPLLNTEKERLSNISILCQKMFDTIMFVGIDSFNLFKYCKRDFNIRKYLINNDVPFCYQSISNFYCNYYISDDNKNTTNCPSHNIIEYYLKLIHPCYYIQLNYVSLCKSFDIFTKKIENVNFFCNQFEIQNKDNDSCYSIIYLYNKCIDYNVIESNLHNKRINCLKADVLLQFCLLYISNYSQEEREICHYHILPYLAKEIVFEYKTFRSDYLHKDYCYKFENTILKEYHTQELNANKSMINIKLYIKELSDQENIIDETKNKTQCILTSFNNTIDKWSSLYNKLTYDNNTTLNSLQIKKIFILNNTLEKYLNYSFDLVKNFSNNTELNIDNINNILHIQINNINNIYCLNDNISLVINSTYFVFESNITTLFQNENQLNKTFLFNYNQLYNNFILLIINFKKYIKSILDNNKKIQHIIQTHKDNYLSKLEGIMEEINSIHLYKRRFLTLYYK